MKAKTNERVGLLWLDTDPKRGVDDKIRRAIARYETKYGRGHTAKICFVHPSQSTAISRVGNVIVRADRNTQPNNFFVCE